MIVRYCNQSDFDELLSFVEAAIIELDLPEMVRRDLKRFGCLVIEPGDGAFRKFSRNRWSCDSVLGMKDKTVYVALIRAKKIGRGYLSELFREIHREGLTIAVISPMEHMTAILTRWGWRGQQEYIFGSVEEVWRKS